MWYVGDLFDEGNLLPFDTCMRRGANEADRLAWYGIVNCRPYLQKVEHSQRT